MKKKIAFFTCPQGHHSLAQAAQEALQIDHHTELFLHRDAWFDAYLPIYQYLPAAQNITFAVAKTNPVFKLARSYMKRQYGPWLQKHIDEYRPNLIINSFYMFIPYLTQVAEQTGMPIINIVSDPWTVHPLIVAPNPLINIGFDKRTQQVVKKINSQAVYHSTGWLVKSSFEQPYDKRQVQQQLNLKPDIPTLLVASGTEGTTLVMKLLPAILFNDKPVQVIVACGNNQRMVKVVNQFARLSHRLNSGSSVQAIGFTDQLHHYMQAADLVVGKAGPNTIFESVATKTPFFAVTHIAGQESGNLDLIKHYRLGIVEENLLKIQPVMQKLLDRPDQLSRFIKPVEAMAQYNLQTKGNLRSLVASAFAK